MVDIFALPKRDGSREFTCTDCGARVYQAIGAGFDYPVCMLCRWLGERPQIDAATQARLRGK
jgi:hypothetical protein